LEFIFVSVILAVQATKLPYAHWRPQCGL